MLSEKDLRLTKHSVALDRLVAYASANALKKTLSLWFDIPELCPRNSTSKLEDYTSNSKVSDILDRMKTMDWVKQRETIETWNLTAILGKK